MQTYPFSYWEPPPPVLGDTPLVFVSTPAPAVVV